MTRFDTADVRRYYDRNTSAFVALGQGASAGAIHRAVWGPGVTTREAAFHFVEERIAALITSLPGEVPGAEPHVVDLGCGIGASLTYLAGRVPLRGTGVTLSPVQARLGTERIGRLGLSGRVQCLEGDYTRLPAQVDTADLAYAIESFVHGPDPARFLAEAARLVRPGGRLVVCDDFRRASATSAAAERTLARFARGWHVNTLITTEELQRLAAAAGFVHEASTDLTGWLELNRPRDRAIAVMTALIGWLPLERTRIGHLIGGTALQTGLSRRWLGYDLAVFRRA